MSLIQYRLTRTKRLHGTSLKVVRPRHASHAFLQQLNTLHILLGS